MKNLSLFLLFAFVILSLNISKADTWRVNNNPLYTEGCDHCFSQLQDAVNSPLVNPGDTIHIEASTTDYEGVDITKRLVIIGTGYFLDENGPLQQNQLSATIKGDVNLMEGSEGTKLIGLRIKGSYAEIGIFTNDISIERCYSGSAGIFFQNNDWSISNIEIDRCYLSQISRIGYPDPINNLHITNCYIDGGAYLPGEGANQYTGVFAHNVVNGKLGGSNGIDYYNNIFKGEFPEGDNSTSNVFNNIFTDELPDWLSESDNMFMPEGTVFVAEGSTDGILQVNPPNICPECYEGYDPGGANDVEIGMFGGNTPYFLSGIPNIPTVYKLHSNTNVYQSDTTHVAISTCTNH
ncbi:MAG: hypothetical protein KQH67_02465 [Bacteroidetes bacterium]|nr:hypothetical protein [Bacteroidota bacterium]